MATNPVRSAGLVYGCVVCTQRHAGKVFALKAPNCNHRLCKSSCLLFLLQVVSFIRVAAPLWSTVSVLLSQLEAVCRVFKVPLAVIDGKELLQLAQDIRANVGSSSTSGDAAAGTARSAVGLPELLCCIANLEEVEHLFTSVSEEIAAAALAGAGTIAIDAGPAETAQSPDGHSACQAATPAEPEQQQEIEGTLPLQAGNTESVPTMPAAAQAPELQRQKAPDKIQKAHGPILEAVVQVCQTS